VVLLYQTPGYPSVLFGWEYYSTSIAAVAAVSSVAVAVAAAATVVAAERVGPSFLWCLRHLPDSVIVVVVAVIVSQDVFDNHP